MNDNGRPVKTRAGRIATFKAWDIAYEELCNGVGQYTTAVVEYEDGTIDDLPLHQIQFTDRVATKE